MGEFKSLSRRLALASADLKAAMYYIDAAAREERDGAVEDVVRLSEEAARKLENVAELFYDKKSLWEKSGDLFWKAGNPGMASRAYHSANELQPGDQKLIEKLVDVETTYQNGLFSSNPRKPYFHSLKARIALEYGLESKDELVQEAISELETLLDTDKEDLEAMLELAWLLKETGDFHGAIDCYTKILDADPENHTALRLLVLAYSKTGQNERAYESLQNAPEELGGFHPRISNPDVWRAISLADSGDFEAAIEYLEKGLLKLPEDVVSWENLEQYFASINRYEEAWECRNRIHSLRNTIS